MKMENKAIEERKRKRDERYRENLATAKLIRERSAKEAEIAAEKEKKRQETYKASLKI